MKNDLLPDKKLAAVCSLFCPSCTVYIGTQEDPARLAHMAQLKGCGPQDLECRGCRSEKRSMHCASCRFIACAAEKNVEFCGDCPEYPCEELKNFQAAMPHRIELWDYHARIKKAGFAQWFLEMNAHFACPECGTTNSAYDPACRKCGATPSCHYVKLHFEKIAPFLKKMRG